MAIKSLQSTVDRWVAGTGAGQTAYLDGVANTDVDVVGRAIAQQNVAQANYNQALTSGLWARRLQAVGTQGWKAAVAAKGGQNWANGIAAGRGKFQARMQGVLQYEAQLQSQIDQMPAGTPAANDARMLAWANGMRQGKLNGAFG
jgi:hypothetical protein